MKIIDSFKGSYSFLSNFHPSVIYLHDQVRYPTVEHAYQAHKSPDMSVRRRIALLDTPGKAKREGRRIHMRSDWDHVKIAIMKEAVRLKFEYPTLRGMLLDTGDAELVEGNTWGDRFWGVCDGEGDNHLGKILMHTREMLRLAFDENALAVAVDRFAARNLQKG